MSEEKIVIHTYPDDKPFKAVLKENAKGGFQIEVEARASTVGETLKHLETLFLEMKKIKEGK